MWRWENPLDLVPYCLANPERGVVSQSAGDPRNSFTWMDGLQEEKEKKKTEFINTKVTMEKPRKFCAPLSLLRCHFFHLFLSLPTEQPPRQYREFLWKNMTKIWNPFKIFWSFLVYLLCRGAFSLKNYNDDE